MDHFLHLHPISVAALLIFALALAKGGRAERFGAALMIGDWLLTVGSSLMVGQQLTTGVTVTPVSVAVFIDFMFSVGLLALAFRFGKLWLGAALLLQGLTLATHALALSPDAPGYLIYATFLNLSTCFLLLCLLSGTLTAWWRRATRRRSGVDALMVTAPAR